LRWLQTNRNRIRAARGDEANPAVRQSVLLSQKLVDPRMQTRNRTCSVALGLPTTFQLDDRISLEALEPCLACAVKPRDFAIVDDPQPTLVPAAIGKRRAQEDDLATDLDQRQVTEDQENDRAHENRSCDEKALHIARPSLGDERRESA